MREISLAFTLASIFVFLSTTLHFIFMVLYYITAAVLQQKVFTLRGLIRLYTNQSTVIPIPVHELCPKVHQVRTSTS